MGEPGPGADVRSDVAPLRRVLLKHARDAFGSDEAIARQWRALHYADAPDYAGAVAEYEAFATLLAELGVDLEFLAPDAEASLDSLYVRDASIVCGDGAILCRMGKPARRHEPAEHEAGYGARGIAILGAVASPGTVEGGDVVWLDDRTVAVGRGYRTNDVGIGQVQSLLAGMADEVVVVPLPHWRGPDGVMHLMSIFSPVDRDLAVVYAPLLPVPFREMLADRGWELVEVPDAEFETLGCNVLAVAPRVCVTVAGNPETARRLRAAGAAVHPFGGREICLKGAGGPTCLTRPLLRG